MRHIEFGDCCLLSTVDGQSVPVTGFRLISIDKTGLRYILPLYTAPFPVLSGLNSNR